MSELHVRRQPLLRLSRGNNQVSCNCHDAEPPHEIGRWKNEKHCPESVQGSFSCTEEIDKVYEETGIRLDFEEPYERVKIDD